jgi:paxillin
LENDPSILKKALMSPEPPSELVSKNINKSVHFGMAHENLQERVETSQQVGKNQTIKSIPGLAPRPTGSEQTKSFDNSNINIKETTSIMKAKRVSVLSCSVCGLKIYDVNDAITVLGKTFHKDHFRCKNCNIVLTKNSFFERAGDPWCEKCLNEKHLLPKCAYCGDAIEGKCIKALSHSWHPEHFFCSQCGKCFGPNEEFMESNGKAYCVEDYEQMFAPKCATCTFPISSSVVEALGKAFHENCFVCSEPSCKKNLVEMGNFFEVNGKPFCEIHYHEAKGSLCFHCNKPISGKCLTVMGKKYHPEHLFCSFCKRNLTLGATNLTSAFKDHAGKPYCMICHTKLYG